jgi:hypothetical protein
MSRPICVHCGQPYGRRAYKPEHVRWDVSESPPPYRGNGIVIKESTPYLGADDHRMVMTRDIWDGESYWTHYKPFCTLRCALDYARRAYAQSQRPAIKRVV